MSYSLLLALGKEKYHTLPSNYYNGAQAVLVVYSITDPDSFVEVKQYWMDEIFGYYGEDADHHMPIILVGTKLDLVDEYNDNQVIVKPSDVSELKGKYTRLIGPIECSAKSGKGIDKVFNTLGKELFGQDLALSRMDRIKPGLRGPGENARTGLICC